MARKTKEDAAKTRQAIIKAATGVFVKKGIAKASLQEIALLAGCTRGAVYWHFSDKADLFQAVYRQMEASAGLDLNSYEDDQVGDIKDIKQIFLYYINVLLNNRAYRDFYAMINYQTVWTRELEPCRKQEERNFEEMLSFLAVSLEALKVKGQIRADVNVHRMAAALCAYVEGLIGMWLFKPEVMPLDKWAEPLLDDFLTGYLA